MLSLCAVQIDVFKLCHVIWWECQNSIQFVVVYARVVYAIYAREVVVVFPPP